MTKQQFIEAVKAGAKEGQERYGILPSLVIAQAILESNWGKSHIENNLFGMKAGSGWTGKVVTKKTKEYINGIWITIEAKFRAYGSFSESIEDHAKLLGKASRYRKVTQAKSYKEACTEVWKAEYATDPDYPKKLISIIEQNELQQYDDVFYNDRKWAMENGISDGSDPDRPVLRKELWAMLHRMSK